MTPRTRGTVEGNRKVDDSIDGNGRMHKRDNTQWDMSVLAGW